jgi:hypothetical protein
MTNPNAGPLTWVAVAAAIISAVYSGFTYNVAERSLEQQRAAMLLGQRVEACAVIERRARDLSAEIGSALLTHQLYGRSQEFFDQCARVLTTSIELSNASVLDYLGPPELARAESDLLLRLGQASGELDREAVSSEAVEAAREAAFQQQLEFSRACKAAVEQFREAS